MTDQFDVEDAEELAVAAIGEPGQRVFYLQARKGGRSVTLRVEKQQVAGLIVKLLQILRQVPSDAAGSESPALEGEPEPDFVVGELGIDYDGAADRVVLMAQELVAEGEPASRARFVVTRGQAAALAREGRRLVEGGRPPCPFCGYPLDQRGHVCPRTNGVHPPLT